MKQIQIKPVTIEVSNVRISIDISTEQKLVRATVYFQHLLDSRLIIIEGAEYDAWGSDDNYIYDLILSKLGLEKA